MADVYTLHNSTKTGHLQVSKIDDEITMFRPISYIFWFIASSLRPYVCNMYLDFVCDMCWCL